MEALLDKNVSALFVLLRAGLWEKKPDDISLFPLSEDEWTEIFGMARKQTVTGIVYAGICRLPDELMPPSRVLLKWVAAIDGIERSNVKMNRTIAGLYEIFRREGLNPVLQKGQGVGLFYEQPLLRECGDIDLYFAGKDESERAAVLVRTLTKNVRKHADNSIYYQCNGIGVEHHTRLIDICNPFLTGYLDDMERKQGFRKMCMSVENRETELLVPAPVLNLLLLNAHIMKHAIGWGVGLRQLCDMARARYALRKEVDADELKRNCDRMGIGRWTALLDAFLVRYLGLSPEYAGYSDTDTTAGPLLDIVLKGGNFGMHASGRGSREGNACLRKLHTSYSFIRKLRFSCRYAPKEGFWTFSNLLTGQFKR